MATKKNKLEKFGISFCRVDMEYTAHGDHTNVRVLLLKEATGWDTKVGITFLRARLDFDRTQLHDHVWEKQYMAEKAEAVRGTVWDVGMVAYGPPFAGRIDTNEVDRIAYTADVLKALGWPKDHNDDADKLIDSIRAAGVPIEYEYWGKGNDTPKHSFAFQLPEKYRGQTAKLAASPECAEAKAAYMLREAAKLREWRAATAERAE